MPVFFVAEGRAIFFSRCKQGNKILPTQCSWVHHGSPNHSVHGSCWDGVCEQRSFVFSIFQGRMRLHLPSQWKKIWAWKMKIWKEEEDLEEDVEVGEHWPIERGSLPNGKCLGQPLAVSAGKGMVTNFFGLAKSRSTLMMNFSALPNFAFKKNFWRPFLFTGQILINQGLFIYHGITGFAKLEETHKAHPVQLLVFYYLILYILYKCP